MGNRTFKFKSFADRPTEEYESKPAKIIPLSEVKVQHRFDIKELMQLIAAYSNCFQDHRLKKGGLTRLNKLVANSSGERHFIHLLLNSYKSNEKRLVDINTFISEMDIALKGTPEDRLKLLFNTADLDGNGDIDGEELFNIVKSFFFEHLPDDDAREISQELLKVMDADGNNSISEEEFVKACIDNQQISHIVQVEKDIQINMD